MTEIDTPNDSAVGFRQVSKNFGALTVFDDLSLTLPKEQITAIVGGSGSGKTTLLQMINGLERPDHGDVEVLGRPVP